MALTDYTFTISDGTTTLDLSRYVAKLTPAYQRRTVKVVTAIDGTEYASAAQRKKQIKVDFKPMTGAQIQTLYTLISNPTRVWYTITYRDPVAGGDIVTVTNARIANEFELQYLCKGTDTYRYYSGLSLEMRAQ